MRSFRETRFSALCHLAKQRAAAIASATLCRNCYRFGRRSSENNGCKSGRYAFLNGRSAEPGLSSTRFYGVMTKTILTARCAPVAIAAILALSSTNAMAQDAVGTAPTGMNNPPPIMQSPVDPVTAPAPAPVASQSPRFVSTPQVQAVPEPDPTPVEATDNSEPAPTTATASSTAQTESTRTRTAAVPASTNTRSATASVPAAPTNPQVAQPSPDAGPLSDQIDEMPYSAIPAATGESASAPASEENGENGLIGLLAAGLVGLIPIGLAIAAVVWWRRRSRVVAYTPEPSVVSNAKPDPLADRVRPAKPVEPAPAPAPVAPREPVFARNDLVEPAPTAPKRPGTYQPAGFGGVAVAERTRSETRIHAAPAVTYDEPEVPFDDVREDHVVSPRTKRQESGRVAPALSESRATPASGASARDSVLERMVSAEPDQANPFTSRKARRRRARLILASREGGVAYS